MATRLEQTILKNLIQNEEFTRKLPYIKSEFFQERDEEFLYKQIKEYFLKYQTPPTPEALIIDIDEIEGVDQQLISDTMVLIREIKEDKTETPNEWLIDSTEKWCKDRAVYNGVMNSISIIQDKEGQQGQIPDILREALSVSFDSNIGHDFLDDWDARYDFMHTEEERLLGVSLTGIMDSKLLNSYNIVYHNGNGRRKDSRKNRFKSIRYIFE